MRKLKYLALLLTLIQTGSLAAQHAEISFNNCLLEASIIDFEKSIFSQFPEHLVCYLEKELIPDIWQKVTALTSATTSIILPVNNLTSGRYRVSFITENKFNTKQTIIHTHAKNKNNQSLEKANVWISNVYFLSEETIRCGKEKMIFQISFYPNPSTGKINIYMHDNTSPLEITINNTMGITLETIFLDEYHNSNPSIDLQHLLPGIYWIRTRNINTNDNTLSKIIIL